MRPSRWLGVLIEGLTADKFKYFYRLLKKEVGFRVDLKGRIVFLF